jgi:hypothetical protein
MGDKLSGLHKCFTEEIHSGLLFQTVTKMKWHQRTVWQMVEECRSGLFLSMTSRQPFYPTSSSDYYSQKNNVLQLQMLKKV